MFTGVVHLMHDSLLVFCLPRQLLATLHNSLMWFLLSLWFVIDRVCVVIWWRLSAARGDGWRTLLHARTHLVRLRRSHQWGRGHDAQIPDHPANHSQGEWGTFLLLRLTILKVSEKHSCWCILLAICLIISAQCFTVCVRSQSRNRFFVL